jgi:hypothetical protein
MLILQSYQQTRAMLWSSSSPMAQWSSGWTSIQKTVHWPTLTMEQTSVLIINKSSLTEEVTKQLRPHLLSQHFDDGNMRLLNTSQPIHLFVSVVNSTNKFLESLWVHCCLLVTTNFFMENSQEHSTQQSTNPHAGSSTMTTLVMSPHRPEKCCDFLDYLNSHCWLLKNLTR